MRSVHASASRWSLALAPGLLVGALCACAPTDEAVADTATSARVPPELQPVMPAPQPLPADASAQSPTAAEEQPMDACNAEAARGAIGRTATADVVEQARKSAGARLVRTLKPGQVVTMEYRADRLNIDVDDDNIVTNLRCG